jgi:peptidoglycan biosynthesis protein MviN/MurJ (putative lipid II flippase)
MRGSHARLVALVIWVCTGVIVYCAQMFLHYKFWVYHPDPTGHPTVGMGWYGKVLFSLLLASVLGGIGYAGARLWGDRETGLSEEGVKRLTYLMVAVVTLGALYTTQHEIMGWVVG